MSKKALITGITGQDGAYLAEFLLAKASRAQRLGIAMDVVTNDGEAHELIGPVNRLDALYRQLA